MKQERRPKTVRYLLISALALGLVVPAAWAVRAPDRSHAPMPNYDIWKGYSGAVDFQDPRVAAELPVLRKQRQAKLAQVSKAASRSSWPAKDNAAIERLFGQDTLVEWNSNRTPSHLFNEKTPLASPRPGMKAEEVARQFLRDSSRFYRLNESQLAALEALRTQDSPSGANHVTFQQTLAGIPIFGATLKVNLRKDNAVLMASGTVFPELDVRGRETLSAPQAARMAADYVGHWISDGHLKPLPVTAWQSPRYLPNWNPQEVEFRGKAAGRETNQELMRSPGPVVLRAENTADKKTWLSRGPFRQDILASLVVYPLTPIEGRWAWQISLFKAPTEWYQIVVDAEDGTLLHRVNLVQFSFPAGAVFVTNPGAASLVGRSFVGTPPATPPFETFVKPGSSGTRGNNVVMGLGANEQPGSDRHYFYGYTGQYETSGLVNFNLDTDRRIVFTRNGLGGYNTSISSILHPGPGADLLLDDDDFACGPPPVDPWPYFNILVDTVCVNSNGNVTFGTGDIGFIEDPLNLFFTTSFSRSQGRIMGLWDDLDPSSGGFVGVTFNPGSLLCFRWNGVPQFGTADSNDFAICLFSDGRVRLTYPNNGVAANDGGVGIIPPFPGTAGWDGFFANASTRGLSGLARFFPDSGLDTRAAATNLFWQLNKNGHDDLWFQGFQEADGNFQHLNHGRGGLQGDPVLATSTTSGFNNAFFGTPPDGVCCPFTEYFLFTNPPFLQRDSAVDSDIIIHEYAHGLTNRLVGGGANPFALSTRQSGGMGEGWSDFYAVSHASDPVIGEYTTGNATTGIRRVAYNFANGRDLRQMGNIFGPFNFSDVSSDGLGTGTFFVDEVHDDGEIWASALASMRAILRGIPIANETIETLVTEALFFTPANPSMLDARTALLAADSSTGLGRPCTLWFVFALHGFGRNAANNHFPIFTFPGDSVSVFGSHDRPKGCGGTFNKGAAIHDAQADSASVGDTTADGWTGTGFWHVTDRRATTGSNSWYYGQESTGDYDDGAHNFGGLTSPTLNFTGMSRPILEFDVAMDQELFSIFDNLWVRASTNGGASFPIQVARLDGITPDFFFGDLTFQRIRVDLSAVGNQSNVKVQFYFDTLDSFGNGFEGAYVDNIQVFNTTQN